MSGNDRVISLFRLKGGNSRVVTLEPSALLELQLGQFVLNDIAMPTGLTEAMVFIIDNGATDITPGVKGDLYFPYQVAVADWTLLGNTTGSIVTDLWVDSLGNYPPTASDSICGANKPQIVGAMTGTSADLTGWTPIIPPRSTMRINVDSATGVDRVTLTLAVNRSL